MRWIHSNQKSYEYGILQLKMKKEFEMKRNWMQPRERIGFSFLMSHRIFTLMTSWQAAIWKKREKKTTQRLNTLVVVNFNKWWLKRMMTDDCVMECFRFGRKLEQTPMRVHRIHCYFHHSDSTWNTMRVCEFSFRNSSFPFRSVIGYLTRFKYEWIV